MKITKRNKNLEKYINIFFFLFCFSRTFSGQSEICTDSFGVVLSVNDLTINLLKLHKKKKLPWPQNLTTTLVQLWSQ